MSKKTIVILSVSLFGALLVWGVYTFIVYVGIPAHALVYMSQEQVQSINAVCGMEDYWCRGWESLPIFLGALFTVGRPFYTYVIISFLAYGIVVFWRGYSRGHFVAAYTLRPLYLVLGLVLSVWFIGTTLGVGSLYRTSDGPEFSRFYEPLPQVYTRLGPEALEELDANYQSLLNRNCLADTGTKTQNGARIYDLKFMCMQQSLVARAGTQLLLIAILFLNFLAAGRLALQLLRSKISSPLLELGLSFGIGSLLWIAALWTISVLGYLQPGVLLTLFFGFPLVAFPQSRYWLTSLWSREWDIGKHYSHLHAFLIWLLVSYLALNFLNVIRPFPIGWDDLGSYLNRPKLLASYGSFIPAMAPFQWEYLSSMAFSMFGLENLTGATFAMIINWFAGLLSVLTIYIFAQLFLGRRAGVLAAILYYFLPMVGHFSFADMKIDNAAFFTAALSLLAAMVYLFGTPGLPEESRVPPGNRKILFMGGLFAGLCFSIKVTGVLPILLILTIMAGELLGVLGFIAVTSFSFGLLHKFSPFNLYDIALKVGIELSADPNSFRNIAIISFFVLAAILAVAAVSRRLANIKKIFEAFVLFGVGIVIVVSPWMIHNMLSHGSFSSGTLLGYKEYIRPYISTLQETELTTESLDPRTPRRFLPEELKLDPDHPACKISAKVEELDRYWGYRTGWSHYLKLPWRVVMNLDSVGYYLTLIPTLLLFPLLLLLPYFWSKGAKWLRLLFAGTLLFLVQWVFVANGIPWYGIGMFLGFAIGLEVLYLKAPDNPNRILVGILITLGILVSLINRMWQFDVQKNLFEYPLGKATTATIREVTIPHYNDIRDIVLERNEAMPDRPYTFRIGTFIPYFIPRNIEILPLADHQLSLFNCINQERDHELTLKRLQALGFNSMIFDTNTATIEKDPNGTLHQKVNAYLDFINDTSLNLDIIISDTSGGIVFLLLP